MCMKVWFRELNLKVGTSLSGEKVLGFYNLNVILVYLMKNINYT